METLISLLTQRVVIAVTGHRDLVAEDLPLLKNRLYERLSRIPGKKSTQILVSALAPGADQLAAEVAYQMGMEVCVLLPMIESDYRLVSFQNESDAFLKLHGWINNNSHVYRLHDESVYKQHPKEDDATKKRQQLLELHAVKLASWADHVIALWDGNDNGQLGGPAHIIRMIRSGTDDEGNPLERLRSNRQYAGRLHHLMTRRQSNPFPLGPLGDATADAAQHEKTWPFGTTTTVEDLWHNKPFGVDGTWQTFLLPRYVVKPTTRQKIRRILNTHYESLLRYGAPTFLFLLTVFFGVWGYLVIPPGTHEPNESKKEVWWGDNWAKAADLADPTTVLEMESPDWHIVVGRAFGILTFLLGVSINLIFVFGDQGVRLFIRIFWTPKHQSDKPSQKKPRGFNIICGLTEASYDLFVDLQSKGERVLILDAEADKSPYKTDCISQGAIVLSKDPVSQQVLADFFVHRAKRLFAMMASETSNLRIIQQAYQLQDSQPSSSNVEWFAQASDIRVRDQLFMPLKADKKQNVMVYSFDLFTNIARRQFHDYPLDRFHLAPDRLKIARLIVVGFGPLAQKLVLLALQTGVYDQGRRLYIRVYTPNAAKEKQIFLSRYPILNSAVHDPQIDPIRNDIVFNQSTHTFATEDIICFEEQSDLLSGLQFGGDLLLRDLTDDSSTSLYVCQDDGIHSVSLLREILPRMLTGQYNSEGQPRDIQAFAFYNSPNNKDELMVEAQLNKDFRSIPITLFGNYLEACSESTICRNAIDNLPELIHWHYAQNFTRVWTGLIINTTKGLSMQVALKDELKRQWRNTTEINRESSRLAADHMWVKYRLALAYFRQRCTTPDEARVLMNQWLLRLYRQTCREITYLNPDDKTNRIMQPILPWESVPPVDDLAIVEHRRWAMDRLLGGFRPLLQATEVDDMEKLTEFVDRWNRDEAFKKAYQRQKMHLDLVPSYVLSTYTTNGPSFQHREKYKDIQQVRAMTLFFRKLDDLEMLSVNIGKI